MSRFGSDLLVDLLVAQDVEYVAFNPGATIRGIQDSLVNRDSDGPRPILALHEEVAVALAHGYAKAAGKPMAVLLHDVVGLQHATMAIYNAWCDRVPMVLIGGTGPLSGVRRRPWIDWIHTAVVQAEQIRHYIKWDDQPADLDSLPESIERAFQLTRADPPGPVYVCLDVTLQEELLEDEQQLLNYRPGPVPSPPGPTRPDAERVVALLREAELAVILTDYAGADRRCPELLAELAETAGVAVVDLGARYNFPTRHPFAADPSLLEEADVVVAIEVDDLHGTLLGPVIEEEKGRLRLRDECTVVEASTRHLRVRSWSQDLQRLVPASLRLTSSPAPFLEALLDAFQREPIPKEQVERRAAVVEERMTARRRLHREQAGRETAQGVIPPERLAAELWALIESLPWTLVNGSLGGWAHRLWEFDADHHHLGWHGGGGLGYGPGASVGAALALPDRISINLQADGDLLYAPQALWTAAHLEVPLLTVVHNNRQYENTVQHAAEVARHRGRSQEHRYVGSALTDPPIHLAELARSMGVWALGPVSTVDDLHQAIGEALQVVRGGRPALVDVLTSGS